MRSARNTFRWITAALLLINISLISSPQASAASAKKVVFVGQNSICTDKTITVSRQWTGLLTTWNDWNDIGADCYSASFLQTTTTKSIGDLASKVVALAPDIVVLSAGAAFPALRSTQTLESAYPVLTELKKYRDALPNATLVVIGGWSTTSTISTLTRNVNQALLTAAQSVSANFIDPTANNSYLVKLAVPKTTNLYYLGHLQLALIIQKSLPDSIRGNHKVGLFIGDSYTFGAGATQSSKRWTSLVAKSQNWNEVNFGLGGIGYLRGGSALCGTGYCPNYDSMLPDLTLVKPDFIVISGGLNDQVEYSKDANAARTRIVKTFTDLKSQFPQAKIYTVGTLTPLGDPKTTDPLAKIDGLIAAGASSISSPRIALMYPCVLTKIRLAADNIHPNDLGHQAIADKVITVVGAK